MPQISSIPFVVSQMKSQLALKKVENDFICAVVLSVPPWLDDLPDVCVSQKLLYTEPVLSPMSPPSWPGPLTVPVEYELYTEPAPFCPTSPPI